MSPPIIIIYSGVARYSVLPAGGSLSFTESTPGGRLNWRPCVWMPCPQKEFPLTVCQIPNPDLSAAAGEVTRKWLKPEIPPGDWI